MNRSVPVANRTVTDPVRLDWSRTATGTAYTPRGANPPIARWMADRPVLGRAELRRADHRHCEREGLHRLTPGTVTAEAENLVAGPRRSAYDHPKENLTQTAELFSAFLKRKLTEPLTAEEVCWLMVLLKASRESFSHSRDNVVDSIGYLRCTELIQE